jgi:heat shock protein HslJ
MVTKTYAVQDGKLVGLGAGDEELVRVSAADLDGTSWSLVEIGQGQPALEDVEVTISFDGDQVSGSAGCNNYNSTFGLAEENPFAISFGPMASTMMACEQPISDQEFAYLTALENATLWGYDYGNLVIAYTDGEGNPDRLLFEPMTNQ